MTRRLAGAVVIAALAAGACRPSSSSSPGPLSVGSGSSGSSVVTGSAAAAPPLDAMPAVLPEPIDVTTALRELPALKADPMIAPATTGDGRQVHGTWCLDGTGADGVMHELAASLTNAGWTNVTTRGDATKAGVSAERDGYRASYVVSASTANACRAPAHYLASLTLFRMK